MPNKKKTSADKQPDIQQYKPTNSKSRKKRTDKQQSSSSNTLILILGIAITVFAVYAILAMISYMIGCISSSTTGIMAEYHGWDYITGNETTQNFMGRIGDVLAILFFKKLFGICSFLFLAVLLLYGIKFIFRRNLLRRRYGLASALFLTMFFSVVLALVFPSNNTSNLFVNILPGQFGLLVCQFLKPYIGTIGLTVILLIAGLIYGYLRYNINVLKIFEKKDSEDEENTQTEEDDNQEDDYQRDKDEDLPDDENDDSNSDLDDEDISDDELGEIKIVRRVPVNDSYLDDNIEVKTEKVQKDDTSDEIIVERPEEEVVTDDKLKDHYTIDEEYDPTLDLPDYEIPPLSLLNDYGSGSAEISDEEIEMNRQKIKTTLHNYSIEIQSIKATVGPTITLYEIVPAPGVRISKIKNLEDDIALNLAAIGIRIIAPIPGRGTIGIEVPNSKPQTVSMKSVLSSKKFIESTMELPIALGKTIQNETYVADLAKMPHLLVAGATGQGKSVGLNAIITSLLYKKHPSQLKFVMVDPKKVEFTLYSKIECHFLAKLPNAAEAIITDTKNVVNTLNSLLIEMDDRYELLKKSGVRNIKEYNARFIARKLNPENGHRFLPYIVVVIDEFGDLIMTAGREVETPLTRLAQLARAIGIHLVIATQRPTVNIITGTIKANFPARIAFRVVSKIDSRTILDAGGADQLVGKGDMLLSTGNDLIRLQCAFVDTDEVERINEYIKGQQGYSSALFLPEYNGDGEGGQDPVEQLRDRDPLFEEVARMIVSSQNGSTSNIQRRMNLGYNRAGRLMDQMEAAGIVGPAQGSKPREIYVQDEAELNVILEGLK
ncbi:MAG: DNA translocase FtsK [Bacteroidales bacterium]|nr:DNA translocase FtsK [Bacteroidales bacterium]